MSKRWMYKVIELKPGFRSVKPEQVEEALNELGVKGWELVTANKEAAYWQLVLKREV